MLGCRNLKIALVTTQHLQHPHCGSVLWAASSREYVVSSVRARLVPWRPSGLARPGNERASTQQDWRPLQCVDVAER